jgi:rhodanese-related sulfurtransferase
MVSQITSQELADGAPENAKIIDVRSAAEFATGHIPGAINVPMEQVESRAGDLGGGLLVIACEAGTRATIVADWLKRRQPVSVLAGGTAAWRSAGLPLVSCAPSRWSLERQVRLAAGVIVLTATLLAVSVNPKWAFLAMFVGGGLTFAAITNICGMAVLLAQMPWNQQRKPGASDVTAMRARCRF